MFHQSVGGGSIGRHLSGHNRSDKRRDLTVREKRGDEEEVEGNEVKWRRKKRDREEV